MAVLSVMVTIGLKVVLVYAAKVLGEYGVASLGGALGFSAGSSGIAQITLMQGGLGLIMSTLMITAPMMVGQLVGSTLGGFSGYNMLGRHDVPRDGNNNPIVGAGNTQVNQQSGSHDTARTEGQYTPAYQTARGDAQTINQRGGVKQVGESQRGAAV